MTARRKLTAIDVFCGAGGLTVGLKRAGFEVLAAIENDPIAVETYAANHPEVMLLARDVRRVTGAGLRRALGLGSRPLDLLAGCPPCQGFSRMRTLNKASSVRDSRNDLLLDFLRLAKALRPRSIMLENVPGLGEDPRLHWFTGYLSRMGYEWEKDVIDAADYGVPQRRKRLIVVASRVGSVAIPSPSRTTRTVRQTFAHLGPAGRSGDAMHDASERRAAHVLRLIRSIPKNGGSRTDLRSDRQLACHKRLDGFHDVYGRLPWDDVAPTITSGCTNPSKGRFLHPVEDRAITVREAALLQTFPRHYWFSMVRGKEHAASMIGNALPPKLIARIARVVGKTLARHVARLSRKRRRRH